MSLNQFDSITSNANMIELMDLDYFLEQTELSLTKFINSKNNENSKIAKILFDNLRKMHTELTSRMFESVTGNNEIVSVKKNTINSFDEKQFISQTYNIHNKKSKYTILKETSIENYKKMIHEINELENIYEKNPDKTLHTKIKILQTKITRQKKRILAVSHKN